MTKRGSATSGPGTDPAEIFRDEAVERLDQMDAALLAVESGDSGAESTELLFRHAHTIKGGAAMLGLDDIRALAGAVEDVLASMRDSGTCPPGLAAPLLRATSSLRAQVTGTGGPAGDILADLAASRTTPPPPGEAPPDELPPGTAGHAAEPGHAGADRAQPRVLRVPAEKIDHLLDLVGEAMHDRRRIAHGLAAETAASPEVADVLRAGDRTLDELKDVSIGMRTLPLRSIAGPLPRAVHDMAGAVGKEVEFTVTGGDTELDRVILESLSGPLTHLLRNAVSHGIEPPAERELAHKPRRGRVEVRAVPRGSLVEIAVTDDGPGVQADTLEEARREGSLAEVLARPGYSTAHEVTELAGRGVGLAAVKAYAQSVGGSLTVSSEPGRGTEAVLLLPLALALAEVLLFERGKAVYGMPLAVVDEAVTVTATVTLEGRAAMDVRGRALPVADFAALTGVKAPPLSERAVALVISSGGRRAVVACDALLGQEEVVVKPLGPLLARVPCCLGATVLSDGRIALLVEPAALLQARREAASPAPAAPGPPPSPKILVVEDSFTVRELQRGILETAEYRVVTARDGREALQALGRDPEVALVLTDLEMPEVDGFELTRAIRADAALSSLPVVIVTAHASEEDQRRGIEAGADAYMAKRSFDQHALLATVERLVGR